MGIEMAIELSQTNDPSPHVRARAKKMYVRSLAPDKFIVTPKAPDKARRVVNISVTTAKRIRIECFDKDTGEVCPANAYGLHCSHAEAALKRLHANIKRNETRRKRTEKVQTG